MPTREIIIKQSKGGFLPFKKSNTDKQKYDFSGISELRQLLRNEKARILHVIKNQKPQSLYELSKKLNRNFKSVYDDVKLLERFGFVELVEEKIKNRTRHRPQIITDNITIHLKI